MSLTLPTGKRRRSSSSSSSSQHDDLFDSPSPRHSPSPSLNNRIQFPQESADATAIIQASASQSQPINAIPSSSTSISKPPQPGPTVKLTSAQLRNALLQQSDVKRAASHNRDHQVKTLKLLSSIRNTYNRVQDILVSFPILILTHSAQLFESWSSLVLTSSILTIFYYLSWYVNRLDWSMQIR